jgi:hypothetical protein
MQQRAVARGTQQFLSPAVTPRKMINIKYDLGLSPDIILMSSRRLS